MFKRHRMFLFPDIELINDIEKRVECLCDRTTLPFQLSLSDICCLGTVQTGEDNFSISLLCLKNLKYSWLNLPRTVWQKCFHAWQNNSRSFSWVVSNIHFWSAVICEHICLLSRLSVCPSTQSRTGFSISVQSVQNTWNASQPQKWMIKPVLIVFKTPFGWSQHELLACASEFQFLTTDFPKMI